MISDCFLNETKMLLFKLDYVLREIMDKCFFKSVMPLVDSFFSWLTPNFAIFGIVDFDESDMNELILKNQNYYNSCNHLENAQN